VKAGLKLRLKMIGAMCNTLYLDGNMVADPPTLFVMKELLPVLVQIIGKWSHDPIIIEVNGRSNSIQTAGRPK
jgi:hypothetical protein